MNLKNTLANCTHAHKIYIFIYCCEIQYVNNIEKNFKRIHRGEDYQLI